MPNIRKQSIEADEHQSVESVETESLRRGTPKDDELKYNGFTSTLYAAYSDIYEDGRLEIRNPGNEWGNVRRLLLPKSRAHRKVQLSPPILPTLPSHGENRGSSPLGSANDFSILAPKWSLVPAGISNFSPMDGASDNQFEIGAVTAGMTRARIAALPAEQIEHAPCL